ncbi:acetate kinase [Corynebacterium uterequi]|uniref:Acetate kinase n=1 Tax=Corynebacterium uterequi TaxID=1072256 RepID=A0A0G3HGM7_9CORY|nr:acetate kinase [Corynebacterium uterequi]AKK11915.1 acetate kinase [Corynebacterium uterequi]
MSYVLVINSGSSSIKFQIVDPTAGAEQDPLASGVVEQIGEASGSITVKHAGDKTKKEMAFANHTEGLTTVIEELDAIGCGPAQVELIAVGHRVVHGGTTFGEPVLIDDAVVEDLKKLIPLAPLHNPANIDGIVVARQQLPDIPHVAVFDTGFFAELPAAAATYPIAAEVAEEHQIRRYGFHGTSHEYIASQVPELLGKPAEDVNHITLHIGNGASASAVRGGHPIDTSMGMTPLAGLVMGTRSGDIDPGIIFHLLRTADMDVDAVDNLLNKRSGMKGMCGSNDLREVHAAADAGSEEAQLALDVYITQLRRILGAYMIELGRVDAIVFTAGVGENDAVVRADALKNLEMYGIVIDEERNATRGDGARLISTDDSAVKVFVVPTNEELAIARKAAAFA